MTIKLVAGCWIAIGIIIVQLADCQLIRSSYDLSVVRIIAISIAETMVIVVLGPLVLFVPTVMVGIRERRNQKIAERQGQEEEERSSKWRIRRY